jgi:hypothetical protein
MIARAADDAGAERRRRASGMQSGAVRAAVLGVNDGLVTNISLILGVVGAAATPEVVLLAGVASLVAGAVSMAVGEYISMRAQVELLDRLLVEEGEAIAIPSARTRSCRRPCSAMASIRRRHARRPWICPEIPGGRWRYTPGRSSA